MEYRVGKQYCQFTKENRIQLKLLADEGLTAQEIANRLGKHKSTIYRELARNLSLSGYDAHKAQLFASNRRQKMSVLEIDLNLQADVVSMLKKHYTPRQISVELAKVGSSNTVSHETIYQFVYSDLGRQLKLSQWLPRKHKKRKPKARSKQKKSPIPNRNSINNRPIEINARKEFGHWEGDLMIFSDTNTNLITLRERVSRVIIAIKNPSKHADVTANNIISVFRGKLQEIISSLTFDNGGEFAQHEMIANKLQIKTYFCDPYSSWQKGTNEQGNGIIRIEMPRHTDIENMSQYRINNMLRNINNRPMQLHDDLSPAEIFKKMAGDDLRGIVALQT